ncbi:hypothetical protein GL50803_00112210 [Giardia duodenalis]|uniref:Uncharacterized protein n=1 Tax=Giardia intestinalis (strain ATCC 50803 / WB clone C6) TaxID=184922 RepID=A8BKM5_GIAIC|nr:hypothetical protein GL50803_00112210 [Giardia intestinalis]KAE8301462.1 hypothetical protein GL50803_00112210 [Giardia intestinalis]|eukprot:XP_001706560.1 Hypothetical protein GL50803_112210 [Giardia lamblia ATCC 50803]
MPPINRLDRNPWQDPKSIRDRVDAEGIQRWHENNLKEIRKVQHRADFDSKDKLGSEVLAARKELDQIRQAVKQANVVCRREKLLKLYSLDFERQRQELQRLGYDIKVVAP